MVQVYCLFSFLDKGSNFLIKEEYTLIFFSWNTLINFTIFFIDITIYMVFLFEMTLS